MSGGADPDWAALCAQVPRWEKLARDADEQTPAGDGGQRMRQMTKPIKQTAYKQRLAEKGLVRRELWVHPQDWPRVQEYAKQLATHRRGATKAQGQNEKEGL